MARLNEPPVMTDNLDALRRKFLRQNRDIARVNSTQSLRIRGLENECARLLSENLELRSQILRLEKDLEDKSAQRIADHAIEVKGKLEAQLIELGSLIAGFGLEPPTKRQSSAAGRRASRPPRYSLSSEISSPQQRKPNDVSPEDAESLAAQEGRLPPIFEEGTYPRRTLNREEILALQSDASEASELPELGPPPVSRLTGDVSTKLAGSSAKVTAAKMNSAASATPQAARLQAATSTASSEPTSKSRQLAGGDEKQNVKQEKKPASRPKAANQKGGEPVVLPDTNAAPVVATPTMKTGAKRKFAVNDENAIGKGVKAVGAADNNTSAQAVPKQPSAENSMPTRELKNPRSIRDLANSRKDTKDSGGARSTVGTRKPLAAKSTNEDVSSPRKRAPEECPTKPKNSRGAGAAKDGAGNGRVRDRMRTPVMLDMPNPAPPAVVEVDVDHGKTDDHIIPPVLDKKEEPSLDADAHLLCPSTPTSSSAPLASDRSSATRTEGRDTPPPADISLQGETSRPSRRARASVSYAEPNLRDKMRRPTKDLVDAVAGEGRYHQRQHDHLQEDDHPSLLSPLASATSSKKSVDIPLEKSIAALSLAEVPKSEEAKISTQPTTATNRRKRTSSAVQRESEASNARLGEENDKATPATIPSDPYEFTLSSSPQSHESSIADGEEQGESGSGNAKAGSRRRSTAGSSRSMAKMTRRSSTTALREGSSSVSTSTTSTSADRHTRPSAARKRASMVAPKRGAMFDDDEEDDPADSSYEPGGAEDANSQVVNEGHSMSTRDRISRRRSMML